MELRPSVLDDLGLEAALDRYVSDLRVRSGIAIDLTVRLSGPRVGTEIETVIYRVTQEALTNAIKSGEPTRIAITLDDVGDVVRLVVTDDGVGFDPDTVSGKGLGLAGMHERAELVNGKLSITSEPGRGTTVELEIPKPTDSGGGAPA